MAKRKPPGRGDGGRRGARGRAEPLPPIDEEVFQDSISEEDVDLALEEQSFVVSSPVVLMRRTDPVTPLAGMRNSGASPAIIQNSESKDENQSTKVEATKFDEKEAVSKGDPSQKWGDRVDKDEPEVSRSDAGAAVEPKKQLPPPERKTWASVVGNSNPSRGIQLDYVPPVDGIVEFTEDIAAGTDAWSNAIVGQIIGGNPSFKEVVGFVHRAWSRIEIPRVHLIQAGVFLFNFQSEESKSKVMARE